jgi:hypothetical protein
MLTGSDILFQAGSVDFISYVSLIPITVVMMTMVAVIIAMPTVPVVIVRIRSVIPIGVIPVITGANPNSDRNLSVRTLHGNES